MLKELLLDIFLPKKCVGCSKEGQYICKDCEIFLSEAPNLIEASISNNTMSVWEYEGLIEKAISRIKNEGHYDIINELVEKAFEKMDLSLPADTYITYVPMYRKKEAQRGFNQSELIARAVGRIVKREVVPLLVRTKATTPQTGLNASERIENVKDSFKLKQDVKCSGNVLLIDDFLITGSTMRECFKALKETNLRNVWGFTLAKVV